MTHVAGVMMVKDEADVIEGNVRHHIEEGLDRFVIADNGSTDGTRDILSDLSKEYHQLQVVDDPEVGYYQSEKMTKLAAIASEGSRTWIIPMDADELWMAEDRFPVFFNALKGMWTVRVPLFNHFCSAIDAEGATPFERIVYRQKDRGALPKVAFLWKSDAVIEQGNHGVHYTDGQEAPQYSIEAMQIRHFPYRSPEQFVHKAENGAKAYAATTLPPSVGAHWRQYGEILQRHGQEALLEVFYEWYHFKSPVDAGMIYDPAPYRRWL